MAAWYLTQTSLINGLNLKAAETALLFPVNRIVDLNNIRPSFEFVIRFISSFTGVYMQCLYRFPPGGDDNNTPVPPLCDMLHGEGVPSISDSMQEIFAQSGFTTLAKRSSYWVLKLFKRSDNKTYGDILKIKSEARKKWESLVQGAVLIAPH
jgi:hypothetical protein